MTLGRIPPHLLGGEIPLDVDAARAGIESLAGRLGLDFERCATGILEISAWNQANALRQVSVKRGLDVRDFMLTTFGGSGSLLACLLVDILDLAGVVVPQNPGNVSRLRPAHRRRQERLRADPRGQARPRSTTPPSTTTFDLAHRAGRRRPRQGGLRRASDHQFTRTVDLRYFGQAYEVRVTAPTDGAVDESYAASVAERSTTSTASSTATTSATTPRQQVEWVNLRVTGVGPITRPRAARDRDGRPRQRSDRSRTAPALARARSASTPTQGYVDTGVWWRPDLRAGDTISGPAIIEEFGSTVPVHPGFTVESTPSATSSSPRRTSEHHDCGAQAAPVNPRACPRHTSTASASPRPAAPSTRSSSRSSRAPWRASRWRSRPRSRAPAAPP